jgi:type IV pilus assembly protein PilA
MEETPEVPRSFDYEHAIGPNAGYYLKHFQDLDAGGSKAGWHWPAFFVTTGWYMYRKMWLPGVLNFLWPLIALVIGSILTAVLGVTAGIILLLLLLAAPTILLSIYAKAIYWRHVNKLIEHLPPSAVASPEKRAARLEREGGTSAVAVAGVVGATVFFYIFVLGILAAIAIPAYQDYTIRAQVAEGLRLATPLKARVAEYRLEHGQWPNQAELGDEMPNGMYVDSVGVAAGSVVIRYGNRANAKISGQRVALLPGLRADGEIVWACGNASLAAGATPAEGPAGSDVPNKYVPAACRGE